MFNKLTLSGNRFSNVLSGPWSMKLFYLGYFCTMGTYLPYLSLYLSAVGLTSVQIALISSILPLASAAMPPLWGWLSDHYNLRKQLLITALLSALICALLLWFFGHYMFALFLLVIILAISISPAIPLADAITLQWVSEHGGNYGSIRVYGSMGFLIMSIIAGRILNVIGINSLFLVLSLVFCMPLLATFFVPAQSKTTMVRINKGALLTLLRDRTLLLFILFCMLGYGSFTAYYTFFGLHLRSLGIDTSAIGLASGLAIVSELPTMMFSGWLLKKLGAKWFVMIGLSVATVRWLGYATFTDYPMLLAFTLLHGISFASFYSSAVTFIDRRVPIHMRTTGQTLFYGATFGIGAWASTNLFGLFYEQIGGNIFFVAAAMSAISILGLLFLIPRNPVQVSFEGEN